MIPLGKFKSDNSREPPVNPGLMLTSAYKFDGWCIFSWITPKSTFFIDLMASLACFERVSSPIATNRAFILSPVDKRKQDTDSWVLPSSCLCNGSWQCHGAGSSRTQTVVMASGQLRLGQTKRVLNLGSQVSLLQMEACGSSRLNGIQQASIRRVG